MLVLSISCFGGENMFYHVLLASLWLHALTLFINPTYRIYILSTRQMRRWWSTHLAGVRRLWEKWEFDSRLGKDSRQVRQWQSIGRRKGPKGFGRILYLKRMCLHLRNQEGYTIFRVVIIILLCCPAVSCCFNVQTRQRLQCICRSSDVRQRQAACNL